MTYILSTLAFKLKAKKTNKPTFYFISSKTIF